MEIGQVPDELGKAFSDSLNSAIAGIKPALGDVTGTITVSVQEMKPGRGEGGRRARITTKREEGIAGSEDKEGGSRGEQICQEKYGDLKNTGSVLVSQPIVGTARVAQGKVMGRMSCK